MDVKYQIFISSTYADLVDERRLVIEAILNLGHIPVGMEAFQASDDTQWDYIKRRIDDCDYYIVIVAERYGSELGGKSYSRMEYEYAVERNVPTAAFLLEAAARKLWPAGKVEHDKQSKIDNFRKLCERKLVKYWRNGDDLAGKVAITLSELIRQKPRTGWVRADNVPSKEVLNEIARLSEEKRALQQRIETLDNSRNIVIPAEYLWRINRLNETSITDILHFASDETPPNLLEIFLDLDFLFVVNPNNADLSENILSIYGFNLDESEIVVVMIEYVKHGLIDRHSNDFGVDRYVLTHRGKELHMYATVWKEELESPTFENEQ